ncbi:MAG TPA: hypothetical protein DEB74_14860 [Lachnospiraceae bacterium]|nr:hypothetical protein [Lachnospiraceae bacterium]
MKLDLRLFMRNRNIYGIKQKHLRLLEDWNAGLWHIRNNGVALDCYNCILVCRWSASDNIKEATAV